MKIVATADLHGRLPDIPECDVLIIAGDVSPIHDHSEEFQRWWLESNFREWLRSVPAARIIGIGGNHDYYLEKDRPFAKSLPWTYLLDESVVVDGVKFHGIPFVPKLSRWAFFQTAAELQESFGAISNDTDVIIAHGPPRRICDYTVPKYGNEHTGAVGAVAAIDRVQPRLFVCGHIHESFGHAIRGNTVVANVSYQDENYVPRRVTPMFTLSEALVSFSEDELPLWDKHAPKFLDGDAVEYKGSFHA